MKLRRKFLIGFAFIISDICAFFLLVSFISEYTSELQFPIINIIFYFIILTFFILFLGGYFSGKSTSSDSYKIILISNLSMPFSYSLISIYMNIGSLSPSLIFSLIAWGTPLMILMRLIFKYALVKLPPFQEKIIIIGDGTHESEFKNKNLTYDNVFKNNRFPEKKNNPIFLDYLSEKCIAYDRVLVDCSQRKTSDLIARTVSNTTNKVEQIRDSKRFPISSTSSIENYQTFVYVNMRMTNTMIIKKRVFDTCLIMLSLPIWLPIIGICSFIIMLTSRGPIFFKQRRIGYNNKFFDIYKFRSMYHDKTDQNGDTLTGIKDSRVTYFGKFLRKSSLDELPQIFNVLLGQMSLVGPRPHATGAKAGDKLYWDATVNYWNRHKVLPGMTGLAQLKGFRGNTFEETDIQNRVKFDLDYIDKSNLLLDMKIICLTFFTLFSSKSF